MNLSLGAKLIKSFAPYFSYIPQFGIRIVHKKVGSITKYFVPL